MLNISNAELLNNFNRLIKQETDVTMSMLDHIAEIEDRKLYLSEGYGSIYEWMEEKFNYSRGSIWRRLSAVHLMRDYPEVRGMLIARELNLTTVSVLHEVVYKEGGAELIPICRGKTQREVDLIIAEYRAKVAEANGVSENDFRKEKVKVVRLRTGNTESKKQGTMNMDLFAPRPDSNNSSVSSQTEEMTDQSAATTDVPESVDSKSIPKCAYRIEITADQELFDLLQELQIKLSSKFPRGACMSDIIKLAAKTLKEEIDKPRQVKEMAKADKTSREPNTPPTSEHTDRHVTGSKQTRYIPQRVREEVRVRDGNCCSYVGTDGRRCGSKWDLEIDHIVPFSCGGGNDVANLRLLCRAHNSYQAELIFGEKFMEDKRRTRQGVRS